MRTLFARLIVALCLTSLVACTTVRPVLESGAAPMSAQQVRISVGPGDKLTITRIDGTVLQLTVSAVLPDAIEGSYAGASGVTRIQIDQIRRIERRQFDGSKSALLGLGIFLGLGLVLAAVVPPMP